jgi:ParB family chromosome partitioning protein
MQLDFIDLGKLVLSPLNMRHGRKAPDVGDILPSIRARGVLVPILVRPVGETDRFEIVAGQRRFLAAGIVAGEARANGHDTAEQIPCAIIEAGDDAAALEASLIENSARLDPDEVTRWEAFTALVKKGRTVDELSTTFGLPKLMIRRTLALGNLLPRIRSLYRQEGIDGTTVRHLTLASKSQQKAWLALHDDDAAWCPTGHQLKAWLFNGPSISTRHALFDLDAYDGAIVTDLFGEGGYFADADSFWQAQNAAIETRRQAYCDAGWADVIVIGPNEQFQLWDHEKTAKRKGGRIYIDIRATGEVIFHEGYLSRKEALRVGRDDASSQAPKAARPEVSGTMQTYIDLHRHAAVRADLLAAPGVALRLMVAHTLAGSHLWRVSPDPRTARNAEVADSIEGSPAEAAFDDARRPLLAGLGLPDDTPTLTGQGDYHGPTPLFLRLLDLPDQTVMAILCVAMGETLASGSIMVEALGLHLGTDMARWWQADDAFFATLRDREVLTAIVADVAGEMIAQANAGEKGKTLKAIVRSHLEGADGRSKVENWVPRWMRLAPSAYTARGGVGTVSASAALDAIRAERDGEPAPDAADAISPAA